MDTTHRTITPAGNRLLFAASMQDDKLGQLIRSAAMDLESIEDDLARDAQSLARRMEGVLSSLAAGFNICTTDEVHTMGSKIDTAIVRRRDTAQKLQQLCSLHPTITFEALTDRSA